MLAVSSFVVHLLLPVSLNDRFPFLFITFLFGFTFDIISYSSSLTVFTFQQNKGAQEEVFLSFMEVSPICLSPRTATWSIKFLKWFMTILESPCFIFIGLKNFVFSLTFCFLSYFDRICFGFCWFFVLVNKTVNFIYFIYFLLMK